MATTINRTTAAITDDDGTGTTGTVYNNAWYQLFCNAIDAIFSAAAKCEVRNSANQSIASGSFTSLTFDTEDHDTFSMHSTSVNTSRITIPSGADGVYLIGASVSWAASGTGVRGIRLIKNGATLLNVDLYQLGFSASGVGNGQHATVLASLVATDYVEVQVLQDTGGAINVLAGGRFYATRVL